IRTERAARSGAGGCLLTRRAWTWEIFCSGTRQGVPAFRANWSDRKPWRPPLRHKFTLFAGGNRVCRRHWARVPRLIELSLKRTATRCGRFNALAIGGLILLLCLSDTADSDPNLIV